MENEIKFFEIVGSGGHSEGCIKYKKGDIIESTRDLEKMFGGKFKRILDDPNLTKKKIFSIKIPLLVEIPDMTKDVDIKCVGRCRLSILICSIIGRERRLKRLLDFLQEQKTKRVEILVEIDNKQLATGAKRNLLLGRAKGDYIAFIDDDDWIVDDYIAKILSATEFNPDCCSLEGVLIRRRRSSRFFHSLEYKKWFRQGNEYFRCPNHLNTVKRKLALRAKFPGINKGEDEGYSLKLRPLLRTEVKIEGVLYYYFAGGHR